MKNIYVMGECVMDFVRKEAEGGNAYRRSPGGCAVNVCLELARLIRRGGGSGEATPFIVARTGRDAYGREIREKLAAAGADTRYLKTCAAPTSRVRMDICADGQRKCAGRYNGADTGLCGEDVRDIDLKPCDAFCFTSGGFLNESCKTAHMRMLQKAYVAGALICFDLNIREGLWEPGRIRELLLPVITLADVIKIKERESEILLGEAGLAPLFEILKNKFLVIYTDGGGVKLYKRGGKDAGVAEENLPFKGRYGEVGAGDRLFATVVYEKVKAYTSPDSGYV